MAPSLRDLIDFLLAEIALCGDQGAAPPDILSFIDTFYAKAAQDASGRTHTVDRRFQEKVWAWLMKNPEVSVGKDRAGNHLSLHEAERRTSRQPDTEVVEDATQGGSDAPDSIRVFVSKERTWLAVTGHEPDESKVLPTEFALLSIIASRKQNGIVQTELVKASGQDKRSVPKRTDLLYKKGYIEKRAIQVKSARTSLCTLRKFLAPEQTLKDRQADQGAEGAKEENMIDFREFNENLFQILRQYKIISRNDLKEKLGFADAWRWRILSRALRKFERIGVLQRVRALSQYAATLKKFHPCVRLLRDPTERDFELFNEFSRGIFSNLEQEDNLDVDEDLERDGPSPVDEGDTVGLVKREAVEDAGRILPCWSADRNIHNMIFDTVDQAGINGITNQGIIRTCFGGYYRRPLENAVSRLVECWQLSQPLHLRHLAIVRDTALQRTITHYVHYTVTNFKNLVDAGEAMWEAVEFSQRALKSNSLNIPPVDAIPEVDEHGLPLAVPGKQLLRNGDATLLQCMAVVKPPNYVYSSSDAVAARLEDGTYTIHQRIRGSGTPAQSQATPVRVKLERRDVSDIEMNDGPDVKQPKSRSKKVNSEAFKEMTEKERLEALGLDETWTEYSVLLIERSGPGVYVTPRGRRRPAGKRQGRPRISRIAAFRSPKLASLPWFKEDAPEEDDDITVLSRRTPLRRAEQHAPIFTPEVLSVAAADDTPSAVSPDCSARRPKRSLRQLGPDIESGPGAGSASKQRRLDKAEGGLQTATAEDREEAEQTNQISPSKRAKRKRAASPELQEQRVICDDRAANNSGPSSQAFSSDSTCQPAMLSPGNSIESPSKTPRSKRLLRSGRGISVGPAATEAQPSPIQPSAPPDGSEPADEPVASVTNGPLDTIPAADSSNAGAEDNTAQNQGPDEDQPAASETAPEVKTEPEDPKGKRRKAWTEKGGSVAVLRRSIVMEILDKAGGAYPMGTELWYPFVTAWQKTRYKETPDLRTIKTVVKTMIDSGRLRQLTFSGKDSKGVMATKSIVYKADLQTNDPLIEEMQKKMLAADRYYFPPNVEIDPEITKSSHHRGGSRRDLKPVTQLPVEHGLTVQLHQKPATVLALEKRRQHSMREELLQRLSMGEGYGDMDGSEIVRLMTLRRRPAKNSSHGLTSMTRPGRMGGESKHSQRRRAEAGFASLRKMRRLWSSIAPYTMLMNTKSTFLPTTGTFATEAGIPALQAAKERVKAVVRKRVPQNAPELPHSLDDLFSQTRRRTMDYSGTADPRSRQFFRDNNAILKWELSNEDLLRQKTDDLLYINQTVQDIETSRIRGNIRFDVDEKTGQVAIPRAPMTTRRKSRLDGQSPRRRKPEAPMEPNHRRLTKLNESLAADDSRSPSSTQTNQRQPIRRSRAVSQMPQTLVRRIMVAIVAVRSLAGGSDARLVDWPLLTYCFPEQDPAVLVERARAILSKYRLQIAKMQSDFQESFIDAYANNQVPTIDYENLPGYDWDGVIDWAITQLDVPKSEKLPDLPATREQFDRVFELREEPPISLDELYQSAQSITVSRKRGLIAGVPFAAPLSDKLTRAQPQRYELSRLEVAKTWVRANVMTPEETYRPADARQALESFGDHVVHQALQSLVTDRAISMGNRGRITPGRNYDVTEHFLFTLGKRRAIESTELRRAQRFKTELDTAIREQGQHDIDYNADDGDMLVVINLFASGRVALQPRDAPREKYGLTDGGYLTRQIDKEKLRFPVEVRPTKSYLYGDPIQEKIRSLAPPRLPDATDPITLLPAKIPLWYDIHGDFVKLLWDLAVAAVVGCVATRPGISASDIAGMIKPTMGGWEVQLMLEWMEAVEVVRREGAAAGFGAEQPGWVVREWWWLVLG
ncbi:TFIIIC transcription initiation factor complex subunits Tfc3 [Aspergillus ellipticus CBS 707.79]|uniref:TFIIIC transcription initiation factor complex subunits Tfc3 n=1 Tax=Aspergillus ellipticus CBS 707.79 TaxID=1448320 RepID=A0A319DFQ8_9EURO|nr:TFIIIC transcription initiation factor complex subunits Tfc3 [Aspergillus ellipticus CBS 707.79]